MEPFYTFCPYCKGELTYNFKFKNISCKKCQRIFENLDEVKAIYKERQEEQDRVFKLITGTGNLYLCKK